MPRAVEFSEFRFGCSLRVRSMNAPHAGRMSNDRRARVPGPTYFFTVNPLERRRTLLVDHIDLLRAVFARTMRERPFELIAAVVLPDHVHCVSRLPEGDADTEHVGARSSRLCPGSCRFSSAGQARARRGANEGSGKGGIGSM